MKRISFNKAQAEPECVIPHESGELREIRSLRRLTDGDDARQFGLSDINGCISYYRLNSVISSFLNL
jgi:hypothetical protein